MAKAPTPGKLERDLALEEAAAARIRLTVDDDTVVLNPAGITGRLVAEYRRLSDGQSLRELMQVPEDGFDLDTLAAWLWLGHQQEGTPVELDTILDRITYQSKVVVEPLVEDDPKA